eukprot:gene26649-48035_t
MGPLITAKQVERVQRLVDESVRMGAVLLAGGKANVHTANIGRGMHIANQLNVGLVHVNDQTVNDDGVMPMGGRGSSGNGSRHGGPANWDEFTQWQWMTVRNTAPGYPL